MHHSVEAQRADSLRETLEALPRREPSITERASTSTVLATAARNFDLAAEQLQAHVRTTSASHDAVLRVDGRAAGAHGRWDASGLHRFPNSTQRRTRASQRRHSFPSGSLILRDAGARRRYDLEDGPRGCPRLGEPRAASLVIPASSHAQSWSGSRVCMFPGSIVPIWLLSGYPGARRRHQSGSDGVDSR